MTTPVRLGVIVAVFFPPAVFAQAVTVRYEDLLPNERIRIASNDSGIVVREAARFLRPGVDTLFIQRNRIAGEWAVPTHALRNLSVVRGSSSWPIVALLAMVVGIPAGAFLAGAGCYAFECNLNAFSGSVLVGAVAGGAIGFKLGYGPHDRWVPVVFPLAAGR